MTTMPELADETRLRSTIAAVLFMIGCMVLVVCTRYPYLPLDSGEVTGGILLPGFLVVATLLYLNRHKQPSALVWFAAVAPWIVALLFVANGAADRSPAVPHDAVAVGIQFSRWPSASRSVVVESWRPGHRTETIPVSIARGSFYRGQPVHIVVHDGALGLPWISEITSAWRSGSPP